MDVPAGRAMTCRCGAPIERLTYGWRRTCACRPTMAYWCALAPFHNDAVAFRQLTGRTVPERDGLYRYGAS